ncbi:MAG: serine hydrolase [Patescibacteria group bacterium]|nr:serine hydrolase [Patescibacteria group bacterium]
MLSSLIIGIFFTSRLLQPDLLIGPLAAEVTTEHQVEIVPAISLKPEIYRSPAPAKISQSLGIETTAHSALVFDPASQSLLFQKNVEEVRPIASLTKLMTALVFLESNPNFGQEAELTAADQVEGGNLELKDGEHLIVGDLFHASLVGSANNATKALARLSGKSEESFIATMNQRAKDLGLSHTKFVDVTGLSSGNVSTALEIAQLANYAFNNSFISEATSLPEYLFEPIGSRRVVTITNTNKLFESFVRMTGSKTGFTNEAGNCLVVRTDDGQGHKVILVVLGSENSESRFQEIKGLITWTFENWRWSI